MAPPSVRFNHGFSYVFSHVFSDVFSDVFNYVGSRPLVEDVCQAVYASRLPSTRRLTFSGLPSLSACGSRASGRF